LVAIKVDEPTKQPSMEIYMIKKADFDFHKGDSSSKYEDTRLALVHHPIQVILAKEAKNVDFMDGSSDSIHNSNDEDDSSCKPVTLISIGKGLIDMLDNHVGEALEEPNIISNQGSCS